MTTFLHKLRFPFISTFELEGPLFELTEEELLADLNHGRGDRAIFVAREPRAGLSN